MERVDASNADLYQSNFTGALCRDVRFSGCDLTYADFSRADIRGSDFTGAKLFRTRLHRVVDEGTIFTANRALALGDEPAVARAEDWPAGP